MKSSKKALAFALAAAMVVTAFPVTNAEAASTAKLSTTKVTVAAGTAKKQTKSIKVTTPSTWKSVKVKVSSSDKKIATVKASGKTVKVTAVKKGSAKVTVKVTAKKAGKAVSKTLTAKAKVVGAGLRITSEAAEVNTGATLALTVKKVPSTAKLTYASKDEAIATVSADGVVTGVKAGKTTITVTSDYGKTVEKEITVVDTVAKLSAVKQTASNSFTATFTADASKVTKDGVKVAATDGSSELAVKSVEVSADKLSANVTVYNNFADGKEYTVTCNDSTQAFTASVGEVTGVTVKTTEAQLNVKTPISYVLTDANGIDVTPAVDLKAKCNITVEGNYSTAEIGDASDAYITMTNVGDVAKVSVSYDNGAKDFTPVTGSGEIKCVKAEAVKADALFTTSTDINANSQCAKFYLGLSDKTVAVEEGGADKIVYFCAKDESGKVVSYDKYDVQSSNEDCVTATVEASADNGKFAKISVSGNTVGSASLTVTTSKNGAVKTYVIPVTVTKKDVAVKMTVDVSRRTMSNAVDYEYNSKVTAKLFDAAGNEVPGNYTFEITNNSVTSPASINATGVFTANNAAAQTYTVKVSGSDNKTSTVFTRNVSITVQGLSAKAKNSAGVAMTYAVEIDKKALDPNNKDARTTNAKLYATCNGVFAGYVREDGKIGAASAGGAATAFADDNTKLDGIKYLAKYGTLKFAAADLVKDTSDAYTDAASYTGAATFNCVKGTSVTYKANDFGTIAKNGTYTVEFRLHYADVNGKENTKNTSKDESGNKFAAVTNTFTVNNTVVVPTVTVDTRKVDLADYVAGLSTDVDMNNNESSHKSITTDATSGNEKSSTDGTKLTVKNVKVTDTRAGLDWTFYVPINTTFTQK